MRVNRLIRRIGLGAYQKVNQRIGWCVSNDNSPRVYMFHSIDSDSNSLSPCSITAESFEKWIMRTLGRGEVFSPLENLMESDRGSYITFDDIYQSVPEVAVPILEKHGIPFTCFVATGLVGTASYVAKRDVIKLANHDLCTIGAHTIDHELLSYCSDSKAGIEIRDCKTILESWTGVAVEYFAYPFGSAFACSRRDMRIVAEAGYKMAFSTINRPLRPFEKENRWFLPRINVEEGNWERY